MKHKKYTPKTNEITFIRGDDMKASEDTNKKKKTHPESVHPQAHSQYNHNILLCITAYFQCHCGGWMQCIQRCMKDAYRE